MEGQLRRKAYYRCNENAVQHIYFVIKPVFIGSITKYLCWTLLCTFKNKMLCFFNKMVVMNEQETSQPRKGIIYYCDKFYAFIMKIPVVM